MTNEELANAINQAWQRLDQTYVGGYTTRETDGGKEMLAHLKALLEIQRTRAAFIVVGEGK
jgi:hypothetical protein